MKEKNLSVDIKAHKELTDDDMAYFFFTLFFNGYETVSSVLTNIIYEICKNTEVQEKLRQEILETIEKTDGKLTLDAVNEMPYLAGVVSEGLRMHPPLYEFPKLCTKATEIDIGHEQPLFVEEGVIVDIPVEALQMDPQYWNNPNVFDPERFIGDNKNNIKRGTYIPFGAGPRICVGLCKDGMKSPEMHWKCMRIGLILLKVPIFYLLKDYEIMKTNSTPNELDPDPDQLFRYHKGGIEVRFKKIAH